MEKVDFYPAKWIWTKDNKTPNQKVVVRKKFSVDSLVESAIAFVACETKFWLWINGQAVVFEGGVFRESVKGAGKIR